MILHPTTLPTEPRIAAGYGNASSRAVILSVTAVAVLGGLVVWALSLLVGG
jgi:hypothetical protein